MAQPFNVSYESTISNPESIPDTLKAELAAEFAALKVDVDAPVDNPLAQLQKIFEDKKLTLVTDFGREYKELEEGVGFTKKIYIKDSTGKFYDLAEALFERNENGEDVLSFGGEGEFFFAIFDIFGLTEETYAQEMEEITELQLGIYTELKELEEMINQNVADQYDWDNDGLTNQEEVDLAGGIQSYKKKGDIDDDGNFGVVDKDTDGDTLEDSLEGNVDTDGDGVPPIFDKDESIEYPERFEGNKLDLAESQLGELATKEALKRPGPLHLQMRNQRQNMIKDMKMEKEADTSLRDEEVLSQNESKVYSYRGIGPKNRDDILFSTPCDVQTIVQARQQLFKATPPAGKLKREAKKDMEKRKDVDERYRLASLVAIAEVNRYFLLKISHLAEDHRQELFTEFTNFSIDTFVEELIKDPDFEIKSLAGSINLLDTTYSIVNKAPEDLTQADYDKPGGPKEKKSLSEAETEAAAELLEKVKNGELSEAEMKQALIDILGSKDGYRGVEGHLEGSAVGGDTDLSSLSEKEKYALLLEHLAGTSTNNKKPSYEITSYDELLSQLSFASDEQKAQLGDLRSIKRLHKGIYKEVRNQKKRVKNYEKLIVNRLTMLALKEYELQVNEAMSSVGFSDLRSADFSKWNKDIDINGILLQVFSMANVLGAGSGNDLERELWKSLQNAKVGKARKKAIKRNGKNRRGSYAKSYKEMHGKNLPANTNWPDIPANDLEGFPQGAERYVDNNGNYALDYTESNNTIVFKEFWAALEGQVVRDSNEVGSSKSPEEIDFKRTSQELLKRWMVGGSKAFNLEAEISAHMGRLGPDKKEIFTKEGLDTKKILERMLKATIDKSDMIGVKQHYNAIISSPALEEVNPNEEKRALSMAMTYQLMDKFGVDKQRHSQPNIKKTTQNGFTQALSSIYGGSFNHADDATIRGNNVVGKAVLGFSKVHLGKEDAVKQPLSLKESMVRDGSFTSVKDMSEGAGIWLSQTLHGGDTRYAGRYSGMIKGAMITGLVIGGIKLFNRMKGGKDGKIFSWKFVQNAGLLAAGVGLGLPALTGRTGKELWDRVKNGPKDEEDRRLLKGGWLSSMFGLDQHAASAENTENANRVTSFFGDMKMDGMFGPTGYIDVPFSDENMFGMSADSIDRYINDPSISPEARTSMEALYMHGKKYYGGKEGGIQAVAETLTGGLINIGITSKEKVDSITDSSSKFSEMTLNIYKQSYDLAGQVTQKSSAVFSGSTYSKELADKYMEATEAQREVLSNRIEGAELFVKTLKKKDPYFKRYFLQNRKDLVPDLTDDDITKLLANMRTSANQEKIDKIIYDSITTDLDNASLKTKDQMDNHLRTTKGGEMATVWSDGLVDNSSAEGIIENYYLNPKTHTDAAEEIYNQENSETDYPKSFFKEAKSGSVTYPDRWAIGAAKSEPDNTILTQRIAAKKIGVTGLDEMFIQLAPQSGNANVCTLSFIIKGKDKKRHKYDFKKINGTNIRVSDFGFGDGSYNGTALDEGVMNMNLVDTAGKTLSLDKNGNPKNPNGFHPNVFKSIVKTLYDGSENIIGNVTTDVPADQVGHDVTPGMFEFNDRWDDDVKVVLEEDDDFDVFAAKK